MMGVVTLDHAWLDTNPRSPEIASVVCMCLCIICLIFVSVLLCILYVIIYVLHPVPLLEFKDALFLSCYVWFVTLCF